MEQYNASEFDCSISPSDNNHYYPLVPMMREHRVMKFAGTSLTAPIVDIYFPLSMNAYGDGTMGFWLIDAILAVVNAVFEVVKRVIVIIIDAVFYILCKILNILRLVIGKLLQLPSLIMDFIEWLPLTAWLYGLIDDLTGGLLTSLKTALRLPGKFIGGEHISRAEVLACLKIIVIASVFFITLLTGGLALALVGLTVTALKDGPIGKSALGRTILDIASIFTLDFLGEVALLDGFIKAGERFLVGTAAKAAGVPPYLMPAVQLGYAKASGFVKDEYFTDDEGETEFFFNQYDEEGFDSDGFNAEGFDADGYDVEGYDIDNLDAEGFDPEGYDAEGYDVDGLDEEGFDRDGFDAEGLDENGLEAEDIETEDVTGEELEEVDSEEIDEEIEGEDVEGEDVEGEEVEGEEVDEEELDEEEVDEEEASEEDVDEEDVDEEDMDADEEAWYESNYVLYVLKFGKTMASLALAADLAEKRRLQAKTPKTKLPRAPKQNVLDYNPATYDYSEYDALVEPVLEEVVSEPESGVSLSKMLMMAAGVVMAVKGLD